MTAAAKPGHLLAVACPTVASMNVCLMKGVEKRLLLLSLELGFLCTGLGWLELQHCKVVHLATYKGICFWTNWQARW